ncbi:CsbD family protein [Virgibacillus ainsalahensis]
MSNVYIPPKKGKELLSLRDGGFNMANNSYEDRAKEIGKKIKGEIKEHWGKVTDDKNKKSEGIFDKVKGEIQDRVGDSKKNSNNERENDQR